MIVCQCKGVSDSVIRAAVREGATTVDQVGLACKAGTDCGGCHPTIERLIEIELAPALPNVPAEQPVPMSTWPVPSILDLAATPE